jgi:hypothetical protein
VEARRGKLSTFSNGAKWPGVVSINSLSGIHEPPGKPERQSMVHWCMGSFLIIISVVLNVIFFFQKDHFVKITRCKSHFLSL